MYQYSNFRTGNLILDGVIAFIIPMIINWIYQNYDINNYIRKFLNLNSRYYKRIIKYVEERGDDTTNKNNILQIAILMYLSDINKIINKNEMFELRTIKNKKNNCYDYEYSNTLTSNDLEEYKIYSYPNENEWYKINNDIEIFIAINRISKSSTENYKEKIIELRSSAFNGDKLINDFANKAYAHYIKNISLKENKDKYMYIPIDRSNNNTKFKQYKLLNEKNFDNIFINDKDKIIELIDLFLNKEGRYKIKGSPYKLGLLLYGEPGTGKTSFIKSLANYTKRNIINIPLSKISTNQDLMDIMMTDSIKVVNSSNGNEYVNVSFDKTIYVLEDIDALSDIVKSRNNDKNNKRKKKKKKHNSDDEDENYNDYDNNDDYNSPNFSFLKNNLDTLNLAGILNILDGIIDTPGRIIIMTTNHIDKLDDALIRPGRIDKKIYMGYISHSNCIKMIEYYYETKLSENQVSELQIIFNEHKIDITPATLEQYCREYENINNLIECIRKHE